MKTRIESSINPHHKDFNAIMVELNEIISICIDNNNLGSIIGQLIILKPKFFIFGRGSNHIWINLNGLNERYLIVTE